MKTETTYLKHYLQDNLAATCLTWMVLLPDMHMAVFLKCWDPHAGHASRTAIALCWPPVSW